MGCFVMTVRFVKYVTGFISFLVVMHFVARSVMAYELVEHPRIFITEAQTADLIAKAEGALGTEYVAIKTVADLAVSKGVQPPKSRHHAPLDQLCLGIVYLVERKKGNDADAYVNAIRGYWGDGSVLGLDGSGHFGFHALVYDWIYDGLSNDERKQFGDALGAWLRWYTDKPEITLKNGSWWYNQTWAPAHLSTPNTRDGITPKLFVALAISGAGTIHEADAKQFLDSWATRVPAECIPAFDRMGGVWSESMGHGNYGPIAVIPWAFEGWRTATGEDLFQLCSKTSYLTEMLEWSVHLKMPWCDLTAWIDDNSGVDFRGVARVSPILAARYNDPIGNWVSDVAPPDRYRRPLWFRFLFYNPSIQSQSPAQMDYTLSRHFTGAGHIHMRSDWDDPNATWAFFGAGPRFGAHARDDEGHFLIAKKGLLVGRAGGMGHNDRDYYAGGSLAFNVVTVYDADEEFRRLAPGERGLSEGGTKNENDGGMIRWVYNGHYDVERGRIVGYADNQHITYSAADLTEAYRSHKVREVTRQFVYVKGDREFFVIFDRVDATRKEFPKTWFLHMPTEPFVDGRETVIVDGHVAQYDGGVATWVSSSVGVDKVLSEGRSRAFLKTLLPERAVLTKRGGDGHDFWGHPHEKTAQYNHKGSRGDRPPVVPWRLEVGSVGELEREYFLHVLEVGDELRAEMTPVMLQQEGDRVGVVMGKGKDAVVLWFAKEGALKGWMQVENGVEKELE